MRVMVLVKETPEDVSGSPPDEADFEAMGRYNEELVNAGVLLCQGGSTAIVAATLPRSTSATRR
jgi:hypothetical protein